MPEILFPVFESSQRTGQVFCNVALVFLSSTAAFIVFFRLKNFPSSLPRGSLVKNSFLRYNEKLHRRMECLWQQHPHLFITFPRVYGGDKVSTAGWRVSGSRPSSSTLVTKTAQRIIANDNYALAA